MKTKKIMLSATLLAAMAGKPQARQPEDTEMETRGKAASDTGAKGNTLSLAAKNKTVTKTTGNAKTNRKSRLKGLAHEYYMDVDDTPGEYPVKKQSKQGSDDFDL